MNHSKEVAFVVMDHLIECMEEKNVDKKRYTSAIQLIRTEQLKLEQA